MQILIIRDDAPALKFLRALPEKFQNDFASRIAQSKASTGDVGVVALAKPEEDYSFMVCQISVGAMRRHWAMKVAGGSRAERKKCLCDALLRVVSALKNYGEVTANDAKSAKFLAPIIGPGRN